MAVGEGDATAKSRYAQLLLEAYTKRRWYKFDILAAGLFLRAGALAVHRAREVAIGALFLADALPEERLHALERGSWMNTEEMAAWQALLVSGAVTDDDLLERDVGDTWAVLQVTRSANSRCCLAVIGEYGETSELVAACSSRTEAMSALRDRGFVSVADYAARALRE